MLVANVVVVSAWHVTVPVVPTTHTATASLGDRNAVTAPTNRVSAQFVPAEFAHGLRTARPRIAGENRSSSCLSSLHLLKSGSLRQTRGGSTKRLAAQNQLRCGSPA